MLAGPVAAPSLALAEPEGGRDCVAMAGKRHYLAAARESRVELDRIGARRERDHLARLDDLGSSCEELCCRHVVVVVQGLAPGTHDARHRGRAGIAATS